MEGMYASLYIFVKITQVHALLVLAREHSDTSKGEHMEESGNVLGQMEDIMVC